MRTVPQTITDAWESGDFVGVNRPMARVTLQRLQVQLQKVDPTRLFASALFGQADIPRELPNVKSVEWDRSVGADVANCAITFYNTTPLPLGEQPVASGDFDLPGWYTFNYGATSWAQQRWGQTANSWQDLLVPDRIIRTFEGYGFDATVAPELDPHLVQTGVWLIDDVEATADGLITVTCRDVGRLLLDHICFPPVIPLANYPLSFDPMHPVPNPDVTTPLGGGFRPTYSKDSNIPYVGRNGLVYGHRAAHAFDSRDSTYWLSIGNALPHAGYSYEYIEGGCSGRTVAAVRFKTWGGPYRMYLSVKIKGKWQGSKTIPYDPDNPASAPNGADIPYLLAKTVARESTNTISLPHPMTKVDAVRITFTNLCNSGIGTYKYRAGVRDFMCYSQKQSTKPGGTHQEGDFSDYTEIVKYLLACGGFHWPRTSNGYLTYSDGTKHTLAPASDDPYLKSGRIWGDLEMSGTGPYVDPVTGVRASLKADIFDKKPLMDGIAYVRDILGFLFMIDETGGAVFRMPNVYTLGNWVGDLASNAGYNAGTANILTIDERTTLLGLRAKISSRNIRDWVFVANSNGSYGATAAGYNPIKPNPGLRRVGGWTDQHFEKTDEAQKMADLITVRQAFAYRNDTLTIIANPAIQIDDQVRIYERTTGEGYYHYVKAIKSSNNLEDGKWTFDLTTNWLGEDPLGTWAFDRAALQSVTQEFINAILGGR